MTSPRALTYAVLALAVAVVSTASILVRYAQAEGAPSIAIAALRLGFATLVLTPIVWPQVRREWPRLTRTDLWLAFGSGAALAVHFAAWITSLEYTSVASSAALVTTNPVWVGIASVVVLRERVPRAVVVGIVLGLLGSLVVLGSASGAGAAASAPLLGNGLALVGALAASAYLLIGRGLRTRISLLTYVWLAYGAAAILLLLATFATRTPLAQLSGAAILLTLALALGPQLIGHTAVNWAVRRASATVVALAILGEPIGAAVLAWLLFGESFSASQLVGFAMLLCGIFFAASAPSEPPPESQAR
ncbi:MAG: DMT family transporter [Burkholderiales bacterium]|nr:DMT family transporter [Burkholderiales bacterium]